MKFIAVFLLFTNIAVASIFKDAIRSEYVSKSMIEEQYIHNVVSRLETLFSPIFKKHGADLLFQVNWEDPTINLYAEQLGFTWFVHVYMGYYTLPEMTEDALALSLCHELGHHISGYPYKSSWSSAEGQADYFANHVCSGMLWSDDDNTQFTTMIPDHLLQLCTEKYDSEQQVELCSRKMLAGLDLAQVMATHSNSTLEHDLVDLPVTDEIKFQHPTAQCRLNTFIHATLCSKQFNLSIIPGKQKARVVPVPRPNRGVNNLWARNQSLEYICDNRIENELDGARPSCWFK